MFGYSLFQYFAFSLIVCSLFFLYRISFQESNIAVKKLKKSVSRLRISKTNRNQDYIIGKKYIRFVIKHHLQTEKSMKEIEDDMLDYANENFIEEAGMKVRSFLPLSIVSVLGLFVFLTFTIVDGFHVLTLFYFAPIIYLLWDSYKLFYNPQSFIKNIVKVSVSEINYHFRDFFNHIYYYYSGNTKVLLTDVMRDRKSVV